jgi:hypothetical protein
MSVSSTSPLLQSAQQIVQTSPQLQPQAAKKPGNSSPPNPASESPQFDSLDLLLLTPRQPSSPRSSPQERSARSNSDEKTNKAMENHKGNYHTTYASSQFLGVPAPAPTSNQRPLSSQTSTRKQELSREKACKVLGIEIMFKNMNPPFTRK